MARYARNQRLTDAHLPVVTRGTHRRARCSDALRHRRAAADTHHAALRALGNRLVGILHGCLEHHAAYDEAIAWGHRSAEKIAEAA